MKQSKQLTEKQQAALIDVWEGDPFNAARSGIERGARLKTLRHLIVTGYIREDVKFEDGRATSVNYKITMDGREKLYRLIDDDDAIAKLTWMANQIRTNLQLRLVLFGCASWLDFAAVRIMDDSIARESRARVFHANSIQQTKGKRNNAA